MGQPAGSPPGTNPPPGQTQAQTAAQPEANEGKKKKGIFGKIVGVFKGDNNKNQ